MAVYFCCYRKICFKSRYKNTSTIFHWDIFGHDNVQVFNKRALSQGIKQAWWGKTSELLCYKPTSCNVLHNGYVVQFNARMQLYVCVTLSSTLTMFILHNLPHSNSLVTERQLMRLFAVKLILNYEQKCKVRSKFLKNENVLKNKLWHKFSEFINSN